ncbi:MAG: hypothetical protein WA001_04225 [Patescibacteria group bacterium]
MFRPKIQTHGFRRPKPPADPKPDTPCPEGPTLGEPPICQLELPMGCDTAAAVHPTTVEKE